MIGPRARSDRQSTVVLQRIQKGVGCATPSTKGSVDLGKARTLRFAGVEVVTLRDSERGHGFDESMRCPADVTMILDFERPICAMGRSGKAAVAFLADKVWKNISPAPSCSAQCVVPTVIVAGETAHVGHRVNRATTADEIALGHIHRASAKRGLGRGTVALQIVAVAEHHLECARGDIDERALVTTASFEQEDARAIIADRPMGGHATRASSANHDVIVRHMG